MKLRSLALLVPLALAAGCQPSSENKTDTNNAASALNVVANASQDFSAHWISKDIILLAEPQASDTYVLATNSETGVETSPLIAVDLPDWVAKKLPHLTSFKAYKVELAEDTAKQWLKQSLYVANIDQQKNTTKLAYILSGFVLDDLYTSTSNDADEVTDLGATVTESSTQFKLWAPTAQKVSVLLFDENKQALAESPIVLTEDTNTGAWHTKVKKNLANVYYQYQVELFHPVTQKQETLVTTDPYSLSLSTNSLYSQVVDLNDAATQPQGWQAHKVPDINKPEDAILYELHIRDFSAIDSKLANEAARGKYLAFTETNSYGINHLKELKQAGLTHIHLLPAFDIGTVNEQKAIDLQSTIAEICDISATISLCTKELDDELTLGAILESFDPKSSDAQAVVSEIRTFDKYNWGYDPFHYTVPEGSYAVNAEGIARIKEFRQMVQSIHEMGFRVVMDVVYNHTHQARLQKTAVLDKIVPNYYQRLNPISGDIEQSTCCDNTATERRMMAKLMNDSLVVWARDYKIDGFRFDLMGHQPKQAMLDARNLVQAVDPDNYFYGEGWNFGEVANNKQFVQASQLELAGTEIGTFSDRLRDAVRGPGISVQGDDIRRNQGIGNGLHTKPNELNQPTNELTPDYKLLMDQVRVGLAGNLANFPIENAQGKQVTGKDIPYGGQPTGYALDPADTISYVSKHDNQTLWDNNQYRNAYDLTTEERVRLHNQGLSYVMLAQGIPFLHMGSELLRSKSYLRDSYDYSDWFNRVDFSKQTNYYNAGLPPADKDKANWPLVSALLDNNQGRDMVTPADINFASKVFMEFMKIRSTSELFRLGTADEINHQVSFLNTGEKQQDGIIAMRLVADKNTQQAAKFNEVMVIFNSAPQQQTFTTEYASGYKLHPIQQQGVDLVVKESKVLNNGFVVPAFTTAVFVK